VEGRLRILSPHIDGFRSWLQRNGYQPTTIVEVVRLLACWADWLQASGFTLDNIIAGFDASAALFKGSKTIRAPHGAGALFIRYLREQGALPPRLVPASPTKIWPILGAFRTWMRGQRGVADSTLDTYQTSLVDLLKILGDDPKAFTAQAVRAFVLERTKPHSRGRAKTIATSTRAFLRYLVATGQCPTGREYAVPRFANPVAEHKASLAQCRELLVEFIGTVGVLVVGVTVFPRQFFQLGFQLLDQLGLFGGRRMLAALPLITVRFGIERNLNPFPALATHGLGFRF
jgi:hypothetical protein